MEVLLKFKLFFSPKDIAHLIQQTKAQQQSENLSQPRRRKPESPKSTSPKAEPTKEPANYTKEQLEMVKRIKRCKDYYEVLGVTKESTDSEIKKAYKKLALQLHPDKNNAPGAVEAFKAVGNAVAVLTDAEKRKTYDLYGSDQGTLRSHNHNYANHEYDFGYGRGGFESDFTAEELFNMFFGNGFPQQRAPTANNRRYQQHRHETVSFNRVNFRNNNIRTGQLLKSVTKQISARSLFSLVSLFIQCPI